MRRFAELEGEDAYELLGISPGASEDEIRRAWRGLAAAEHPDRVTDPRAKTRAEKRIRLLNAARDILISDRAAYDAHREALLRSETAQEAEEIVDDPWADATAGRPRTTTPPPPPPPPPPPRPPGPRPGTHAPPPPGQAGGLRRWFGTAARLGLGRLAVFAVLYGVVLVGSSVISFIADSLRPSPPPTEVEVPEELAGTWVGTLREQDGRKLGKKHWDVQLTLKSGKKIGEVRYHKGRCIGKAVPIDRNRKTVTLKPEFDKPERCNPGLLDVKPEKDGRVLVRHYRVVENTKVAVGFLRRRKNDSSSPEADRPTRLSDHRALTGAEPETRTGLPMFQQFTAPDMSQRTAELARL